MENKGNDENYNKKQIVKGLFAILITSILMLSLVPALPFATNTTSDTTNQGYENSVVTAKAANVKVTWNANGGKVGTKKTTVTSIKKGTKLKKLPTTPKRVGYTFKGWYTKKTGGTKITKNTKPKKKVTYYAQWKKGISNTNNTSSNTDSTTKRVLTAEEKKLVGKWVSHWDGSAVYQFNADGTFFRIFGLQYYDAGFKGTYSLKNGILTLNGRAGSDYGSGWTWKIESEENSRKIEFGTINGEESLKIDGLNYVRGN